jgi:murein DD-endopeptidase MepM/ murein hydrolase activator NlpD
VNRRPRLLLALVAIAVLAGIVVGIPAVAVAGPTKGTGGWYWPTGTEKLGSMDGYWVFRSANHSWHMAKDIATPPGHAVYAIADGVVAESKGDAGYGGVLVIWHTTAEGQKFLTVYGHINRKGCPKGAKVKAGQVIGTINSAAHVHFGIHPGSSYPPDRNPYRGHTYTASNTYGWVDPIKFLKAHPAHIAYCAPPLPLVTTISTASTATVVGVADGSVYWRLLNGAEEDSATVFATPLPSGPTTQVAEDAVLPAMNTTRYLAAVGPTSFSLYDRQPLLSAAYATLKPGWKHSVGVTGTLRNAAGKTFAGAPVVLERKASTGSWTIVARTITGLKGVYTLAYAPSRSYLWRVRAIPLTATYVATATVAVTVCPTPGLHAPDSAKQAGAGKAVTITGKLEARHTAGAHTVTLRLQKFTAAGWVDAKPAWTTNANSGSATRYSRKLTLAPGIWRVSASCGADSLHAGQTSAWAGFRVK